MASPLNDYIGQAGSQGQSRVSTAAQYQIFKAVKGSFYFFGVALRGVIQVLKDGLAQVFKH